MLKQELTEWSATDVQMTKHGYVYGQHTRQHAQSPRADGGLLSLDVDTAPDCTGKNVKPIVHRKYDGPGH